MDMSSQNDISPQNVSNDQARRNRPWPDQLLNLVAIF